MNAVFIKELRQFCRSVAGKGAAVLMAAALLLTLTWWSFSSIAIQLLLVAAPAVIVGGAAARWRRELGDPAFAPCVTTPLAPAAVATAKLGATLVTLYVPVLFLLLCLYWNCRQQNQPFTFFNSRDFLLPLLALHGTAAALTLAIYSRKPGRAGSEGGLSGVVMALMTLMLYFWGMLFATDFAEWQAIAYVRLAEIALLSWTLIAAGAAPAASNRLLPFKSLLLFCTFAVEPLSQWLQNGSVTPLVWSECAALTAGVLTLMSLGERREQSRRVLSQQKTLACQLLLFPVSTGAVCSWSAALICVAVAEVLGEFNRIMCGGGLWLMAVAALTHLLLHFRERTAAKVRPVFLFILVYFISALFATAISQAADFSASVGKLWFHAAAAAVGIVLMIPLFLRYWKKSA